MIKFENIEVTGWEAALRGMRNPKESWSRSDSTFNYNPETGRIEPIIGANDLDLAMRLRKGGSDDRKFLRMIRLSCDIEASHTFWAEFDTYKVSTVRNSCSKMHRIHVHPFTKELFDHEGIDAVADAMVDNTFANVIATLERLRTLFNETKEKRYWRAIIELLPMGFRIKATVDLSYETLCNIFRPASREYHKLDEWCRHDKLIPNRDYFTDSGFCDMVLTLPYAKEFILGETDEN